MKVKRMMCHGLGGLCTTYKHQTSRVQWSWWESLCWYQYAINAQNHITLYIHTYHPICTYIYVSLYIYYLYIYLWLYIGMIIYIMIYNIYNTTVPVSWYWRVAQENGREDLELHLGEFGKKVHFGAGYIPGPRCRMSRTESKCLTKLQYSDKKLGPHPGRTVLRWAPVHSVCRFAFNPSKSVYKMSGRVICVSSWW